MLPEPVQLLEWSVRTSLVLAVAFVVTLLLRRQAAATRHFVWTCAVIVALVLPVLQATVPDWPVVPRNALPRLASAVPQPMPAPGNDLGLSRRPDGSEATPAVPSPGRAARTPPLALISMTWALGTAAVLAYMLLGVAASWRIRRMAVPSSAGEEVQELAEAFAIASPIAVVESPATSTPLVCGLWRPRIVLPHAASEWTDERRHVVMLHELAHVKRRDCLTQALAQLVCAAYWFNPLAWIAARRLRVERERACDDFVLAAGIRGSDYANHLLGIAQTAPRLRLSSVAAGVAMARRSQLEGRLMAILDPAIRRKPARAASLAAAALIALVTIPLAALQLTAPATGVHVTPSAVSSVAPAQRPQPAQPRQAAQSPQAAPAQTAKPPLDERLRRTLNRSLIEFAEDGDLDAVEAMLAAGADANAQVEGDGSPLISAAGEGHYEMVRLLLDRGADPNLVVDGDGTALIAAAEEGHADVVDLLLQRGADINLGADGDGSALIAAAGEGHLEVVRRLIDRGADVNLIVDGDGTALIAASDEGHTNVVDLLLQRGADPNLIADGDETALIQASNEGHLEVAKLLVSRGADVNLGVWVDEVMWFGDARDVGLRFSDAPRRRVFRTPLSEARGDGHADVVRFLISAGARD